MTTGVEIFVDDDVGYLRWLASNPDGWVLNARRNPSPSYLKLHESTCHHVSDTAHLPGAWTERGYVKVCSGDRDSLERWAAQRLGGSIDHECYCVRWGSR